MGDFNIDLHNEKATIVHNLEEITLGMGLSPVISTHTHQKPGCNQTCIDNIFTNSVDGTICSGTISVGISHHMAIFLIFDSLSNTDETPKSNYMQYYDYCNSNVENFIDNLGNKLMAEPPMDFSSFYSTFNTQLDEACKLEQPKCTKRTVRNNPWITPGIIASVKTKHELYGTWKKASKKNCSIISATNSKSSTHDHEICPCYFCRNTLSSYEKYKAHRKILKHLITRAKQKFYGNKINECAGDSKKPGK